MTDHRPHLPDVIRLFLRLGLTAFGGPAVHIAMMRDEVVRRRRWLTDQEFLDLLGIANLIPGPSSTELAIYIGHARSGGRGVITAGVAFILPAVVIVLACAWGYVTYGKLPAAGRIFYGVTPVLIAVIVQALWELGKGAIRSVKTGVAAAIALTLALLGVNVVALLLVGGAALTCLRILEFSRVSPRTMIAVTSTGMLPSPAPAMATAVGGAALGLLPLFAIFFKIGAVLFGSGYVLLAFLHQDLVVHLRWITDRQLLDAIAVGQFTPGPVFTTATFIGYVLAGLPGALVATIGIFLPSFLLVAITYPFVGRLRSSRWASAFLDGVNAISVALMAAVTWHLAQAAFVDALTVALGVLAILILVKTRVNSALLIIAGGLAGLVAGVMGR